MKKISILLSLVLSFSVMVQAEEVYRLDAVSSAYTTPDAGKLLVKTKDNLPRMADYQTKFVLRFDPFFFAAEVEDITVNDIIKAEVLIVSVLEGGLTGTSRRVDDGEVLVYECDNSWVLNEVQPDPFELGEAIVGPIYYPAIGANDGTEEFLAVYETPTRIDITDFFKSKFEEGDEFSIDFIKSREDGGTAEFTRMGGHGQSNPDRQPRIEITYEIGGGSSGLNAPATKDIKVWSSGNAIYTNVGGNYAGKLEYTLFSIDGRIIDKQSFNKTAGVEIVSDVQLSDGLYFVKLMLGEEIIVQKVLNK